MQVDVNVGGRERRREQLKLLIKDGQLLRARHPLGC